MRCVRKLGGGLAWLAWIGLTPSVVLAQAPLPEEGCYVRDYGKGVDAQNMSWIRLRLTKVEPPPPDPDAGSETVNPVAMHVGVKYSHWSLPAADFGYDKMDCSRERASIRCPIDCDGGAIHLRPLVTGDLLVEGSIRVSEGRLTSLVLSRAALESNFRFEGTHVLKRASPDQCKPFEVDAKRVLFQAGDYHLMVQQLNAQLAKLGHLPVPAEPLYSKETVAAMRAFQESVGYEPTGVADARSVRTLNVRAVTTGGC